MLSMQPKELNRRARVEIFMLNKLKNPIKEKLRVPKWRIMSRSRREMSPKQERHTWSKQMAIATTPWATARMELSLLKIAKVAQQVLLPGGRALPAKRAALGRLSTQRLPRRLKEERRRENVQNQRKENDLRN